MNWTPSAAPWTPWKYAASCLFGQAGIGMFGGNDRDGRVNDEYWDWEGHSWSLMPKPTGPNQWPPARTGACMVNAFSSNIPGLWLFGGVDASGNYCRDVWRSNNGGCAWQRVAERVAWTGRENACGFVSGGELASDNRLWIFGGYDGGDYRSDRAWSTADGITWTQSTPVPSWAPRSLANIVSIGGHTYLFGGQTTGSVELSDLWVSDDLQAWTPVQAQIPPGAIAYAGATVHRDGSAYIAGGTLDNKVWRLSPAPQLAGV